jgi:ferredoxin-type protein NapH
VTIAILLKKEKFSFKLGIVFLFISTLFGFLFFSPMMPYTFQLLVLGNTEALGVQIPMALVGLVIILALTFVFGRIFCGYVCPIGTVQELLSRLPMKQKKISQKKVILLVHSLVFVLFLALAIIFSINLLDYIGIFAFFNLQFSSFYFIAFVLLLLVSIFIYRPFCRFICPYGLLLSLVGRKSVFNIKRNENCIDCGICEKTCPTDEAGLTDYKQECYVCMRCDDVCPKHGISYTKRTDK